MRGEPDNAVAYFDRVAQADPGYVADSPAPRKSIWTYVGRAHYNSGRYAEAKVAFDKALTYVKDDYVARLYRGLTMLRVQSSAPPANVFTLQEVSYALREGVAPRRVSTLARERGVAFDLNVETETQLKNAGADTILLDDLRKLRAERVKQNQPSDNQRNEGAKEITTCFNRPARLAQLHYLQHCSRTFLGSVGRDSRGNCPGTTRCHGESARLGGRHHRRRIGGLQVGRRKRSRPA